MTGFQQVAITKNQSKAYTLVPTLESQVLYYQKTIENVVSCTGIGVHSGMPVTVTLYPAVSGSGITFVRTDLGETEILAHWQAVMDTRQCTTIGNGPKATVSTIEHLMAALAANSVDNLRIEINGPELPIMDGSAKPFMEL
ncbi:MAG: UDP-3-O-acyl-N-acetylglucosamine deacetylase, partial [Alphaproteobacteria bacterium]|nr:UDP-3-O-acyl-N-acetylglucosamine deacetylase [Alphaproteobacteria bacterium]